MVYLEYLSSIQQWRDVTWIDSKERILGLDMTQVLPKCCSTLSTARFSGDLDSSTLHLGTTQFIKIVDRFGPGLIPLFWLYEAILIDSI
jgi:hypothetical protein